MISIGKGQQAPPSNKATVRACCPGLAKLWSRQHDQRADRGAGEATPALSGRRRLGVAAGLPKEKKERENLRGGVGFGDGEE